MEDANGFSVSSTATVVDDFVSICRVSIENKATANPKQDETSKTGQ